MNCPCIMGSLRFSSGYDGADVAVLGRSDGELTLKARLSGDDRSTEITMILDEQSYEIREYRVKWPDNEHCETSEVYAKDGRYGIEFEFPDTIKENSDDLISCGPQTLGPLSDTITREVVFPGSCGPNPARNVIRYHFSLDKPSVLANIKATKNSVPLRLRILGSDAALKSNISGGYFSSGVELSAVLPRGEYAIEVDTFNALAMGGFALEINVTQVSRVASISSSSEHTCALDTEGRLFCWGNTDFLEINPSPQERFQSVGSGPGAWHTCGLKPDGTPICYGVTIFGETSPPEGERFMAISGGERFTCALREDGSPVCWGVALDPQKRGFISPPPNQTFSSISCGGFHTCALTTDGRPVCWGSDYFGQASPPDSEVFASISSGGWHTCGLRADGTAVCWGKDEENQASPPEGEGFTAISSGHYHTCALRADGTPLCWGSDDDGRASPPQGEKFTAISSGAGHTCGVTTEGAVLCWGDNRLGQASSPNPRN